jgi:hypothetical protein
MCRHIDFIAVLVIAIAMAGFSKASSIRMPVDIGPVQLRNVANVESCPIRSEILSRLENFLNR